MSAKREAIVRAATEMFRRYGYRKTSVELIAREAEVAKPTIYAHFADKDALFVAVCQDVMDRILAATEAAARGVGDAVERITAMLAAKFTTLFELVDTSPHARELLDSRNAEANAVVATADAAYVELLAQALAAAAKSGQLTLGRLGKPKQVARLLMQAGHGASYGASSPDQHRSQLSGLVRAILGPAHPAPG